MQYSQKMNVMLSFAEEAGGLQTEAYVTGIIVLALFVLVCVLARLVTDFSRELRILNIEINRTEGAEREHYIRQRRRLWLSLLPFIRY